MAEKPAGPHHSRLKPMDQKGKAIITPVDGEEGKFYLVAKIISVFVFDELADRNKTLKLRPWYYGRCLVVMTALEPGTDISDLRFDESPFWVHVKKLPFDAMTYELAQEIGDCIGDFISAKRNPDGLCVGSTLRIRVRLFLDRPIIQELLVLCRGEGRTVELQYEKLDGYCTFCGRLSHVVEHCEHRLVRFMDGDRRTPPENWGDWLRYGSPVQVPRRTSVGVNRTHFPYKIAADKTGTLSPDFPVTIVDHLNLSMADSAESTDAKVTGSMDNSVKSTPAFKFTGRWADKADTQEAAASGELTPVQNALDSLTIEDTTKINKDADSLPEPPAVAAAITPDEIVTAGDTIYGSAEKFEDLNLSPELLKGLYVQMKFEKPSKIQAISLPMILTPPFKNLVAQAHNGSGKTTCFVLGMLSRIDTKLAAPQALCICPTRELATQNMEVLLKMGKFTGIKSELAIPADGNHRRSPITAPVVIGTPGTISRPIVSTKLSLSFMKILVFDEADHMLAEGSFRDDSMKTMKSIAKSSPDCQVLLFSATFNDAVGAFVDQTIQEIFHKDYNQMFVRKEELSLASVKQYKVNCPDELAVGNFSLFKNRILELGDKVGQTIRVVRTRNSASMLRKSLVDLGYEVTSIQGDLQQQDRDKIVKEFKEGLTSVLISTDILARGFDQDPEPDYEVYLHRVGRAGRFGRKGAVFNLLCDNRDKQLMAKIEKYYNCEIAEVAPWQSEDGFEDALINAGLDMDFLFFDPVALLW
ncbi:OLC1v1010338C1 [Oldenlandia corymbosa var. corymbosa]|uniref:RNA helicase n=1 Tax=Oldenlandia corymbosa var. corymbosa TaxID=529605 RepID=A0AAV1DTH2_OLDCO|nr:OLC1v1010338C1 [Oldenlandia corymbosa var. corymbosa]